LAIPAIRCEKAFRAFYKNEAGKNGGKPVLSWYLLVSIKAIFAEYL